MPISMAMCKVCLLVLLGVVAVQSFAVGYECIAMHNIGLLTQTSSQLSHFLQSSKAVSEVDISGHRFYKRIFNGAPVVMSYTGNGLINGAIAAQLLITSFPSVRIVINFGLSASPNVKEFWLGDIVIPAQLAHTGVWYWQNQGDNSNNGVESLTFGEFNTDNSCSGENKLNRVWFQDSEVHYSFDDSRKVFWVNGSTSVKTPSVPLKSCADVDGTEMCLPYTPKVYAADAGCSSDMYISNAAYAKFLLSKFNCSTLDKDSAAVALTSLRNHVEFVTVRSILNSAGVSSDDDKYSALLHKLANENSVITVGAIVSQLTASNAVSDIKIRKFFGCEGN